jgi:DNA invertase Pin-like site-specific DNA recombinase
MPDLAWTPRSKLCVDGDVLVVWKLDRLGRNLRHLVNTVHDLTQRKIGFKVLTGQGATIDTTEAAGKLVFGIFAALFAALAEFERELMSERTKAGFSFSTSTRQKRRRAIQNDDREATPRGVSDGAG